MVAPPSPQRILWICMSATGRMLPRRSPLDIWPSLRCFDLADLAILAGPLLIVLGVAQFSLGLALIVAGLFLLVGGWLWELGQARTWGA
jgi:hypothetical protein